MANYALTNLPGRVEISASNELVMTDAQITGQNYTAFRSPHQFDGSAGALIQSPYSDINVGVTNGFLTITNLIAAQIPNWGGTVQAWSTRFFSIDPNTGNTNDYRVLIVGSQLTPTTLAQVQDLFLHGTNSIVISDSLNVMRSFYADARSLTLTTNPFSDQYTGSGSTSLDGELNLESPGIFWQSSTPNLRFLTNNGAIRMQNLTYFGFPYLTNVVGHATNVVPFLFNTAFINNGYFMDQGSVIYAGNFQSSGVFSNGVGNFTLQSFTTTLTNGALYANGDVSITASSLVTSNLYLEADRSLTLTVTNFITDTGPSPTNLNFWVVGSNSVGSGFSLPIKPPVGDLLGTKITLVAPANRHVVNVWSGVDRGLNPAGYTNNIAVGRFVMDAKPSLISGHNGTFIFNGAGVSNALYIDELILEDYSTVGNATNNFNFSWLQINTNLMIYFANAVESGVIVSEQIDNATKAGGNNGRLRWISSYAGYYSSTNVFFTNLDGSVITNTVNPGLVQSQVIDSDGDGTPNYHDPTPFFEPTQTQFTLTLTNLPPLSARVQWITIPNATNFVYYTTNLLAPNWLAFTNFKNWYYGNNVAVTNATHGNSFRSPQIYVANQTLPDNSQRTNVWVYDAVTNVPHYYKVVVWPWLNFPE